MPSLKIHLSGDGAWPDMAGKELIQVEDMEVAALEGGMSSGLPSVAFRIDLPDGRVVFAQASMRLFLQAADLFRARYAADLGLPAQPMTAIFDLDSVAAEAVGKQIVAELRQRGVKI